MDDRMNTLARKLFILSPVIGLALSLYNRECEAFKKEYIDPFESISKFAMDARINPSECLENGLDTYLYEERPHINKQTFCEYVLWRSEDSDYMPPHLKYLYEGIKYEDNMEKGQGLSRTGRPLFGHTSDPDCLPSIIRYKDDDIRDVYLSD